MSSRLRIVCTGPPSPAGWPARGGTSSKRTRQQLALAVGASGAEVDSIVRVLGSELDVSLSKLG